MRFISISLFVALFFSIIILLTGCGGDSGYAAINPTPTPGMITKTVSGYIYYAPSADSGEAIDRFIILDVPASSGDDSLLSQLTASQQEHPEDQEVYSQLKESLSTWKPLSTLNGAKLYTVYQDTKSETPISVGPDGHFESTVSVRSTDDTVHFQVSLDDKKFLQAETIAASDITSSSQATGELKSCPERIIALPDECVIFEVFSTPAINLKNAGLSFTLNNSALGCVTKPTYLKIGGKMNYNVAYGVFSAKKGLTTPVNTTITAQTTTGLKVDIFTEVIKSTASIIGHIGGTGVVPAFGFVLSLGPDACSLLDSAGNYSLPKVFKGHGREILGVWWIKDGSGKLIRHMDVRVIDFLSGDVTGFNIPQDILPTPTTLNPYDPYYAQPMGEIRSQFFQWQKELGEEESIQRIVKWLNGELSGYPVPKNINYVIRGTDSTPGGSNIIWIYFTNSSSIAFCAHVPISIDEELAPYTVTPTPTSTPTSKLIEQQNTDILNKANTFRSSDILILSPAEWEGGYEKLKNLNIKMFQWDIADDLKNNKGYKVDAIRTTEGDTIEIYYPEPEYDPNGIEYELTQAYMNFILKDPKNIVRVEDFLKLKNYGIIAIITHYMHAPVDGIAKVGLTCCVLCKNDVDYLTSLMSKYPQYPYDPNGIWYVQDTIFKKDEHHYYPYVAIYVTEKIFENQDLSNSFIFLNTCYGLNYHSTIMKQGAKALIAPDRSANVKWSNEFMYKFFSYLINDPPMSIGNAFSRMEHLDKMNPDPTNHQDVTQNGCKFYTYPEHTELVDTYFPVPVNVVVHKAKGE